MSKPKQISCKVCGKLFTPCGWCRDNNSTFRWRNFACSIECAKAYVAQAEKYNEQQMEKLSVKTKPARKKQKKAEAVDAVQESVETLVSVEKKESETENTETTESQSVENVEIQD